MKRGDLITAVGSRDYGKARPSLVVQSDRFNALLSVVICPLTSDMEDTPDIRLVVEPTEANGLKKQSQIMIDKVTSIARGRCGEVIGSIDSAILERVDERLALLLGIAD